MKVTSFLVAWLGAASASAVGCGGTQNGETAEPVVMSAPDDFVLRDVRKEAAGPLGCQVPNVTAAVGPWAGSEGNVTAYGCGYQAHFYLRCVTNHQCTISRTD